MLNFRDSRGLAIIANGPLASFLARRPGGFTPRQRPQFSKTLDTAQASGLTQLSDMLSEVLRRDTLSQAGRARAGGHAQRIVVFGLCIRRQIYCRWFSSVRAAPRAVEASDVQTLLPYPHDLFGGLTDLNGIIPGQRVGEGRGRARAAHTHTATRTRGRSSDWCQRISPQRPKARTVIPSVAILTGASARVATHTTPHAPAARRDGLGR